MQSLFSSRTRTANPAEVTHDEPVSFSERADPAFNRRARLLYNTMVLVGLGIFGATYLCGAKLAHHHVPDWAFQLIRAGSGLLSLASYTFADLAFKRSHLAQDRKETEVLALPAGFEPAKISPFTIPIQLRQAAPAIGGAFGLLAAIFLWLGFNDTRPGPQDHTLIVIGFILLPLALLAFVIRPFCPRLMFQIDSEGILAPFGLKNRFFPWRTIDHFEVVSHYGVLGQSQGSTCYLCTKSGKRLSIYLDSYTQRRVVQALRERFGSQG
jgi:hypothetical protein